MASNCSLYKNGVLLGTGSIADSSASVTSWVAAAGKPPIAKRNVQVVNTQAGTHIGRHWQARVLVDNGAGTLTLSAPCPHVGA